MALETAKRQGPILEANCVFSTDVQLWGKEGSKDGPSISDQPHEELGRKGKIL